ncbi:MAG TPA: CoA ester lyase [Alphaproteobacteria bacterium]|nr:CoA ester lyase [Alphaproteobacteria bacterium]
MSRDIRPRRSALFMPGSNARALEKAKTLPADCVIFDLEDAVAPDAKATARGQAAAAVEAGGYGERELVIRVNGLDTDWGSDDLKAAAAAGPQAVLLPKVEHAAQVRTAATLLPEAIELWCMIETPLGVLNVAELAAASPRVRCLVVGTSDLSADLNVRLDTARTPLLASLSLCVLAARAHGLTALDGVHLDLDDDDGFLAACHQGRDLGFDGKSLIHPRQIASCNRVFAPESADLEEAQVIVDAFAQAEAEGRGVVVVNGRLVENLHVAQARRLLTLADAIARRERAAGAAT